MEKMTAANNAYISMPLRIAARDIRQPLGVTQKGKVHKMTIQFR